MRDTDDLQRADELARFFSVLEALQKVDRAGLREEALLLAFECGVFKQFKQEIGHAENKRDD